MGLHWDETSLGESMWVASLDAVTGGPSVIAVSGGQGGFCHCVAEAIYRSWKLEFPFPQILV